LLLVAGFALAACGIKAPPVPLSRVVPKRIVDLEALSRDGNLVLVWSAPKENEDRTVLTDLEKFQILRSEGVLISGQCTGCGGPPKPFYEVKAGSPEEIKGKKIFVTIEDQEPGKVYVYQLVSINRRGYSSAPSNPVTVYWDAPPPPPSRVEAERGNQKVDLAWESVPGATGYNVYRREGEGVFPLNPLTVSPLTVTEYADLSVQNDVRYIYSIRSVKRVVKTDVEGKGSLGFPVTPAKLIPPAVPTGLVAVVLEAGVELNWQRNQEPDLLGYNVYRRKIGEEKITKLTETPVARESYLDRDVEVGQEYDYAISALDNSPLHNESPLSEEVRIKYLY